MVPIITRQAVESDIGYILDSFLQGARSPVYSNMKGTIYFKRYKPILLALLKRSQILIACLPDDPNTIAGFVVYDFLDQIPIIHWVQTRKMFKQQGIAKHLLNQVSPNFGTKLTVVSHLPIPKSLPNSFHQLSQTYNLQYDPFIVTEKV